LRVKYKTKEVKMGFFSNLFKKKSERLTPEQIDEIDERVEETQQKFAGEKKIWADLSKSSKKVMQKPVTKVIKRPVKKVKKKAKKVSKKKIKKGRR
jgi:hypothetical protein